MLREILERNSVKEGVSNLMKNVDQGAFKKVRSEIVKRFTRTGSMGYFKIRLINGEKYEVDPLNLDGKGLCIAGENKMLSWQEKGYLISGVKNFMREFGNFLDKALKYQFEGPRPDIFRNIIDNGIGYGVIFKAANKAGLEDPYEAIETISWETIRFYTKS